MLDKVMYVMTDTYASVKQVSFQLHFETGADPGHLVRGGGYFYGRVISRGDF